MDVRNVKKKPFYEAVKRIFDFLLALVGTVVLSPCLLLIAIAIVAEDKGSVFYKANRVGRYGKPIKVYKFRSMKTGADRLEDMLTPEELEEYHKNFKLEKDPRITRVGNILRKTSLDELPQIFQIFSGEMSIIGPRPALWNQFDLIEERDKYGANDVRPGLTGWAQINGRDELPIDVKARFDGEYVERMSFLFDCKCFFGTIVSVLKHDGVVEGGTGQLEKEKENK